MHNRQWQAVFRENQVIVCTHQVLLNLLEKGSEYMSVARLALLIIDECHEATKAHPCVKVMQFYAQAKAAGSSLPLVFGMTVRTWAPGCACPPALRPNHV
jgi:ERCC4-related helicase